MKLEIKKSSLENVGAETVVIFVSKKSGGKPKKEATKDESRNVHAEGVSRGISAMLEAAAEQGVLTGAANETVFFREVGLSGARHLLAIGLGECNPLEQEVLRQAAATAVTALKAQKSRSAAFSLDSLPHNSLETDATMQALAEGASLSSYSFNEFKSTAKGNGKSESEGLEKLLFITATKSKDYEHGLETGKIIADCVNFGRWLGDRPGNRMTPSILAEETVKAAKGSKLKVTVWDKARIKSEKMTALLSVSLGSAQDPRFIIMEYKGAASSKSPICFVGKGLTFDSGGISIKPSSGMDEMKFDMCGGANVIATMLAIARLKLKVNVIGLVPATENMPGPAANKPGDIVIARNGKSIEVNNTDAEGRVILADALSYASEQKPAMIIDAATLTGAMQIALGNLHTGVFTRNEKILEKIKQAAKTSGEWIWPMPLTDFHSKDVKGTYADLSNVAASGRGAGSATAAAFLEYFVDKDIPWAHFDIAGTGWNTGDRLPYCPKKGASGTMIRTFVQLAMDAE